MSYMKVNFVLQPLSLYKNTGIYTYINEVLLLLKEKGINVEINKFKGDYDILHIHDFSPSSILLSKLSKKSTITTAHTTISTTKGTLPKFLDNFWKFYLKHFYNSFDKVIATSPKSIKEIENIGIEKEKIEYLTHGVNLKKFSPNKGKRKEFREKLGIEKDETVIFNVSRVEPRKGIYEFVEMSKFFPECRFVWFGILPHPLTPEYFKISKSIKNAPQNVIFTGRINDITNAFNAGDIFFFPSTGETFGLSIAEAAACSKPVLLKDLDDFSIFDFAIKYKTKRDCIEKIECLLNKSYYNRYEKLTIAKIKKFDIKNHINGLVEIYEKLLK